MKVEEGDYLRVALIIFGGAAGMSYLALGVDNPAFNQLRQAGVEVFEKRNYTETASHLVVALVAAFQLLTFVAGEASSNYSQVDKLWSIIPAVFAWVYAYDLPSNSRLTLMALVISIWAIRLTLNFNRRGGYHWPPWLGEEDYRWKHVQDFLNAKKNVLLWKAFHLGFICIYQVALLYLITLPCHFVWYYQKFENVNPKINEIDIAAALAILGLITAEAITDEQQYEFQETKYELLNDGVDKKDLPMPYAQGFVSTGMFAYSRHMNYFCEISIWYVLNLFIFAATQKALITPALGGAILLSILFQGSIWLQEQTTAGKWPLYKQYIKQVPQLFPYGSGFSLLDDDDSSESSDTSESDESGSEKSDEESEEDEE